MTQRGKHEVSSNLINQLQILLRTEAGIRHPSDLQHAFSAIGSPNAAESSASARCDSCKRELLRGPESIICVYCGLAPLHASPPQDLSLMSTLGFQGFLRSLSLDGSETVERQIFGGNESSRGRSLVKDEILLRELLDLKLKWPDESSRVGVENETGKRSLLLVGIDFHENLPTEGSRDLTGSSSNEQVLATREYETEEATTFLGNSNLSLFESTHSRSAEGENDGSSNWEAEFQSANADVDGNHASHMDPGPGPFEQVKSAGILSLHALSTSNVDSISALTSDSKHSEIDISAKHDEKGFKLVDDSSFSWLPVSDQYQKSDQGFTPQDEKRDWNEFSDDWDDFRMFTGAENSQGESSNTAVSGSESGGLNLSDSWNNSTKSAGARPVPDQLHSKWDAVECAHGGGDDILLQGHVGLAPLDVHVESKQNVTFTQVESVLVEGSASKEVHDSFDLSNGFTSVIAEHDQHQSTDPESADSIMSDKSDNMHRVHAVLNVGNSLQQAGGSEAAASMINGDNDDSFDAWSDFAGSGDISISRPTSNDAGFGDWGDLSTLMITSVNHPQITETKSAGNEALLNVDDGYNLWSEFSGSGPEAGNNSGLIVSGSGSDRVSTGKVTDNLTLVEDNKPHNSWGNFGWPTSILEQQSHSGGGKQFENKVKREDHNLFSGFHNSDILSSSSPPKQPKSNGVTMLDDKSASRNDDAWSDFTSSSNSLYVSNANASVQEVSEHDAFNVWNVIASPPNKQAVKEAELPKGDLSEIYLFSSSVSSKDIGSNSSLHSDPLFGMLTAENGSAQVAFPQTEAPNFVRMEDGGTKAGDSEQRNNIENVSQESLDKTSSVAETLISEMHDLSFMLESSLSIPKSGR